MNTIFIHNFIPLNILKGDIIPILKDKKGNISDSGNYRPIMQSSCLLKIIEIFILDFLSEKINFNSRQFGFLSKASTSHATLLIKEIAFNYTKNKSNVYTLFADLSKAFDRVDHFKLGSMLIDRGVPTDIVKIIMVYLRNQFGRIKWNDSNGEYKIVNKGVRQGGILSPFLFKLYIDDLLTTLNNNNEGCIFGLGRVAVIAYADDMVILASSSDALESIYKKFEEEIEKIDLKININKTKCMIFGKNNNFNKDIMLNNQSFEILNSFKYLGNILNSKLDDTDDVDYKLQSFYKSFYSILTNFNNANIETFLFIFNSFCMPNYGTELWTSQGIQSKNIFRTFEVAYCRALKRICNLPNYTGNHFVAAMCSQYLLNHFVNLKQVLFLKSLETSKLPLFLFNKIFIRSGNFYKSVFNNFIDNYQVNVFNFDVKTLKSRIQYIQLHEKMF